MRRFLDAILMGLSLLLFALIALLVALLDIAINALFIGAVALLLLWAVGVVTVSDTRPSSPPPYAAPADAD